MIFDFKFINIRGSLPHLLISLYPCLCRWQKRLFSFFRAYVVDRSDYFLFFMLMSLTEAFIFIFSCLCRWQERLFSFFRAYVVDRSVYFHFFQGLDFSLSLTLPYPIRNSLPFTSLRSVTVGSGRGFLEGDTLKGKREDYLNVGSTLLPIRRTWLPTSTSLPLKRRSYA